MKYIYRFWNKDNECLYVGQTIRLKSRFNQHRQDKEWWNEVDKIEYAIVERDFLTDLYEIYYINKIKGKYNARDVKITYNRFDYPELIFTEYDMGLIKGKTRGKRANMKMFHDVCDIQIDKNDLGF